MLRTHRRHVLPFDDSGIRVEGLLSRNLKVRLSEVRGIAYDERGWLATLGRATRLRARLTVCLSGRIDVFHDARWMTTLEAGSAVLTADLSRVLQRTEGRTQLDLDWDARASVEGVGEVTAWKLSPATLGCVRRLAASMTERTAGSEQRERAFDDLRLALRAEGVALPHPLATDDEDQPIGCAIGRAVTQLEQRPTLADLESELGNSSRSTRRSLARYLSSYGIVGTRGRSDWRSVRDYYRLMVAAVFMAHPASTTERVAKLVGYGSPSAMCHAFAHARLPSPRSAALHPAS